jgi:uncharacterized protein (TIGR03437 family)
MTSTSATASDALFQVDGQWITGAASFGWPAGSKHTLSIPTLQVAGTTAKTRYLFQGWLPWANTSNQITITADAGITSYSAGLAIQYAVTTSYFPCPPGGPCNAPGTIWIDHLPYVGDTDVWVDAGSTVSMAAEPVSGNVFTGWGQGGGNLPPVYTFVANAPALIYPRFAIARQIQLNSFPAGLQLLADREPVGTPITLEWGWNTAHQLSVLSPQRDNQGLLWMFQSWSDGGGMNHAYQVQPLSTPDSVTAQFARAVEISLVSQPVGLALTWDGAAAVTPKNLYAAPGEVHTVAAPLHLLDASGAPWVFQSWANGTVTPSQSVAVALDQADSGIRLTAVYAPRSRVRIVSIPSGLTMTVDGTACATPCEIERSIGAAVQFSAPASVMGPAGVRYDFLGWDGTNGSLTAAAGFQTVTARYSTSYLLTLSTRPTDAGTWQVSPPNSDGFFLAGTAVAVSYLPSAGARFQNWELDLSGPLHPGTIVMNAPHAVRAVVVPAPPAPRPLQVSSAATDAPTVAPGSLASLFGTNLADITASGASNPLPQTLGGVSLVCAGRIFPLVYVSPGQINFQVASDLDPGQYQLEIHRASAPLRQVAITIARDAPGLLVAVRPDGSVPTEDAPAHPGEELRLYGTGFGPYTQPLPDGFLVPDSPPVPLTDGVEIRAAGRELTPDFAGAAPAMTGIVLVQIQLPDDLAGGDSVPVQVVVGGVKSNTLAIPFR